WYVVSPYEFIQGLLRGGPGNIVLGFWAVLTVIIFLNFVLLRQKFCATVCPYAKLQSTLFDNKTMVAAFDSRRKEECINCMACLKICPVGIDIRNYDERELIQDIEIMVESIKDERLKVTRKANFIIPER
ncbi:MAG: 4Fe-4S binding protein, partial [Candidatus Scalindua sp.]